MKHTFLALVVSLSAFADSASWRDSALWTRLARHSVSYFDLVAWDPRSGSYLSDISFEGKPTSEARHLIALSRMIYGLSAAAEITGDRAYLVRAEAAARFIREKMVRQGASGPHFVASVDGEGKPLSTAVSPVNEQAYGLCGPVALYRQTGDRHLLNWIRGMYRSFRLRYHDDTHGGFLDGDTPTKSYNSTVYVATSFLFELHDADTERQGEYRLMLLELADLVVRNFLDPKTGWIVENFDREWRPSWRGWQKQGEHTIGVVGHNFQAAWMLLRAADIADPARRTQYQAAAKTILESMLRSRAVDRVNGGFGDVFQRETGLPMWHTNKAWWQQAEGILALTLAERRGVLATADALAVRDAAVRFYAEKFVDARNGGEFKVVSAEGQPVPGEPKGEKGKSTYHSTELSRFLIRYANGG